MTAPSARVVVGIDGSPASAAALRWAAAEARIRGLRLHVVQVLDQHVVVAPGHLTPSATGNASADHAAAESAFKALICEPVGTDGELAVQPELVESLPSQVLLDRAAGAALLVLGSSRPDAADVGPVGKPPAPLGPVARDCLRAASCPVVIVTSQRVPLKAERACAG